EHPWPMLARCTSPTNIGMGLLSALAAHDFGFLRTRELADRLESTFATIEGLERFEGHLLNWYDTTSLAPLVPRYVSTVDSGNLSGALLALAGGLRRSVREPQGAAAVAAGLADAAGLLADALQALPRVKSGKADAAIAAEARAVRQLLLGSVAVDPPPADPVGAVAEQVDALAARVQALSLDGADAGPEGDAVFWMKVVLDGVHQPLAAPDPGLGDRLEDLAQRCEAIVSEIDYRFLFD